MKINLYTSFKKDDNEIKNKERIHCLTRNLQCGFNRIHLICPTIEDKNYFEEYVYDKLFSKVGNFYPICIKSETTFNDFFDMIDDIHYHSGEDTLSIIARNDIYFNSLQPLDIFYEGLDMKRSTVLALSSWYVEKDGKYIHNEKSDSQDTWVFYGSNSIKLNEKIPFSLFGSDNRIAHELTALGYRLINPSKQIKTYRLNSSPNNDMRNIVAPPYLYVEPY